MTWKVFLLFLLHGKVCVRILLQCLVEFIHEAIWPWSILPEKDIFMGFPRERIENLRIIHCSGTSGGRNEREMEVMVYGISNYLTFS